MPPDQIPVPELSISIYETFTPTTQTWIIVHKRSYKDRVAKWMMNFNHRFVQTYHVANALTWNPESLQKEIFTPNPKYFFVNERDTVSTASFLTEAFDIMRHRRSSDDLEGPSLFKIDDTEFPREQRNPYTNQEDIMIFTPDKHYEAHYDPERNESTFILDFPGQDLQGFAVGLEPVNNGDVLVHIASKSEGDAYRFQYKSTPHTPVDAHNPPHVEWKYGRLTITAKHIELHPVFWPIS